MFVTLIGRLVFIEIISGNKLTKLALDQWTRDIPLMAERGDILDANGIVLADSMTSYTIFVRPNSVKDKERAAKVLSSIFNVDYQSLKDKLYSKVSEITVAKQVSKSKMLELVSQDITGIYYSQNIKRIYPYGDFMTQVLGFTNIDSKGQSGVEAYYNKFLQGRNGYILTETDLVGRELESNTTKFVMGSAGNDVYLTLDYNIQSFVEKAVNDAYNKYQAKSTSCIVLDPKTGAVVALAERPSYDLNNIPRDNIGELFSQSKSSMISNVYEPGSTFKIVTTAMGLDQGFINRNYKFYCPGYRIIDGKKIKCWKTIGHGSETFDEGVYNSCNCLFIDIAGKVGANNFYNNLNTYGLTAKTGIDMSGEASGLTIPKSSVKNVDLARMGFGQAIAVTGIELVAASAAIINGGNTITPHILNRIETKDKKMIYQFYETNSKRIIKESTSLAMREILQGVVDVGSGKNAKVAGYAIGGKTGTAQKYENGNIASGKYVSTFLGFAPADNPEYIVLFIVDEPKGYVYYGSLVAAPYVGNIFKNIFDYRGMLPKNLEELPQMIMPDLMGMDVLSAIRKLKEKGVYYETIGDGNIVNYQFPAPGSYINKNVVAYINLS